MLSRLDYCNLLHLYSPSCSLRSSLKTCILKLQSFNHKTHDFHTFSHFSPTSGEKKLPQDIRHYSLFLQKQTQDISLLRIFQLSNIVFHPYQSVQCVCVCVHACVRVRAYVHLAHSYVLNLCWCVHYLLAFVKLWVTFSISMHIKCVILCLFNTLSHGVGGLQISIIIIIICGECTRRDNVRGKRAMYHQSSGMPM